MSSGGVPGGRAYVLIELRDKMTAGLKAAEKRFQEFGTSVSLSAGIAFAGASAAIGWPLKLAGDMEQTTTSFRVFLGSAEKAAALVKTLDDIAVSTPYELSTLTEASRMMLASGLNEAQVPEMLNMIGDIAQGDKEAMYLLSKAFADVAQNGKLMAQENNQFRNSGFNPLMVMAEQMAKQFGGIAEQYMPDLRKRMEEGTVSVFEVAEAMRIATSEGGRFHGMQVEQAQTFKGLMSTLWDYINRGLRKFGETILPIFKNFVRIAIIVSDAVGKLVETYSGLFRIVGIGIAVFAGIMSVFTVIGGTVLTLSFAFGLMASIIGVVFTKAFLIFTLVSVAILAVVGVLYFFRNEIYGLANAMYMVWEPVIKSLQRIYGVVSDTLFAILDVLGQGKIEAAANIAMLGFAAAFWEGVNAAWTAFTWFLDMIGSIVPYFNEVRTVIGLMFGSVYDAILGSRIDLAFGILFNNARIVVQIAYNKIMSGWNSVILFFQQGFAMLNMFAATFQNNLQTGFELAVLGIRSAVAQIITAIEGALAAVGQADLVAGLYDAVKPTETVDQLMARRQAAQDAIMKNFKNQQFANAMDFAQKELKNEQDLLALRKAGALMEAQAAAARKKEGVDNFAEKAAKARKELDAAIAASKRPAVDPKNSKNPIQRANDMLSQDSLLGKYMKSNARGTFSAIAATYLGREATDYDKQTAQNTKETASAVKNLGLVFGT